MYTLLSGENLVYMTFAEEDVVAIQTDLAAVREHKLMGRLSHPTGEMNCMVSECKKSLQLTEILKSFLLIQVPPGYHKRFQNLRNFSIPILKALPTDKYCF